MDTNGSETVTPDAGLLSYRKALLVLKAATSSCKQHCEPTMRSNARPARRCWPLVVSAQQLWRRHCKVSFQWTRSRSQQTKNKACQRNEAKTSKGRMWMRLMVKLVKTHGKQWTRMCSPSCHRGALPKHIQWDATCARADAIQLARSSTYVLQDRRWWSTFSNNM